MKGTIRLLLFALCLFAPAFVQGAVQIQTKADLLLSHAAARPGDTVTAALRLKMPAKVHTYWRNPGDSGLPTSIDWELPPGFSTGAIEWPVPHKYVISRLYAYVYEGEVLLRMPLSIAADVKPGTYELKGKANWLECTDENCIPGDSPVAARFTVGSEQKPSPDAALLESALASLPVAIADFKVAARWDGPATEETRPVLIEWKPRTAPAEPDFFPFESESFTTGGTTEVLQADSGIVTIRKNVESSSGQWPAKLSGLIVDQTGTEKLTAVQVEFEVTGGAAPVAATTSTAAGGPAAPREQTSLLVVLAFAFLGGLILNIMPCVLPVIALKILSFVNQTREEPRRARELGLVYALGVLFSFLILAGLVIGVQRAGNIASWGMQYQNPVFLVSMTALVTLIALNLFGAFEITLGGSALGKASEFAGREGKSGAFFNGVLATILGTSCTAPFLTFAIGYALSQPSWVTVLVFSVMAAGLAFPYVLLTWNPRLLKFLPKPGAWMESFKKAMGFPMLATALWLFSVTLGHFGVQNAFWLGLFLLLLAISAWVYGEFYQRGTRRRPLALAVVFIGLIAAFGLVLEGKLQWRNPVLAQAAGSPRNDPDGIQWEKWSPEAVAQARAAGRPVLVDFTADWCLNCQVNKATSIEIEPVEEKLKAINAVALLGDFTRKDKLIAEELQRFQRGAVPLVLVYPADPAAPAIVLPAALTPSIVLNALDEAAKKSPAANKLTLRN